MTFAPETIKEARAYLKSRDPDLSDSELGIVGGSSHVVTGTSYHLGRDQLKMSRNPYSARTARDLRGLSNAASALDIDDDLDELRPLSIWLVEQCRAGAPDTLDIREIIYSPDGTQVLQWDAQRGTIVSHSDLSHRTHTHISYYRDSEHRDKVGLFRRFFEGGNVSWQEVLPGTDTAGNPTRFTAAQILGGANNAAWTAANNSTAILSKLDDLIGPNPVDVAALAQALAPHIRAMVRAELDGTKLGPAA